jgi:multidrug transporter EmrE-like cation transporter
MNNQTLFLVLVSIAAIFEAAGDIVLKKWSQESRNEIFMVWLLLYIIGIVIWGISLKYEFLSKAISVMTIINLIIVVLVWVLYFQDDLSIVNKVGIILGIISVILIEQ